MTKEVLALALTVLVHVIGMAALVWALLFDDENRPDWRGWWPGGDDEPPAPPASPRDRGGLPLPDAVPSAVRLREPGRLADGHPRPARRPAHAPVRVPARASANRTR
ncbi:MAG TPA: hypothetical protein VF257_06950 [Solirubrobacteraceae bacterium]